MLTSPTRFIDVFNGDADGLCALHQVRLAEPAEAVLVTGVKRDIGLLERVEAGEGDVVTVLDLSLDRNRGALQRLLAGGAKVRYFDHHYAGEVPSHANLEAVIDTATGICTSMLVDRSLGGRFRSWAVVAAFGDNLDQAAVDLGGSLALGAAELEKLRELGRSLNYNAYGESEFDLLISPAALYRRLARYDDPLRFIAREEICGVLDMARRADLEAALALAPRWSRDGAGVYLLPDMPWSRRVNGAFANHLARVHPDRAQAVLAPSRSGGYIVSLRVPADAGCGADEFCRAFPGGGGRRDAAGIDRLPPEGLAQFEERFAATFG
jgi:hypothetical protein